MKRIEALKFWRVFRSSITGQYVTRIEALRNPATTVSEKRWPDR